MEVVVFLWHSGGTGHEIGVTERGAYKEAAEGGSWVDHCAREDSGGNFEEVGGTGREARVRTCSVASWTHRKAFSGCEVQKACRIQGNIRLRFHFLVLVTEHVCYIE